MLSEVFTYARKSGMASWRQTWKSLPRARCFQV